MKFPSTLAKLMFAILFGSTDCGLLDAKGNSFGDEFEYFRNDLWTQDDGTFECRGEDCVVSQRKNLAIIPAVRKNVWHENEVVPKQTSRELNIWLRNDCYGSKCCGK